MQKLSWIGILVAAVAATPITAFASLVPYEQPANQVPCGTLCPDIGAYADRMTDSRIETRTFSSGSCDVQEGSATPGTHRLLRFTATWPNFGPGDLYVGAPSAHPEWFVWGACHGHYHFREYADYRLWTPEMYARWSLLRASDPLPTSESLLAAHPEITYVVGAKAGFCVIDLVPITRIGGLPAARYRSCGNQGITATWADEYHWSLAGQYIVLDGIAPGRYVLEEEANAERVFKEEDYSNNAAAIVVQI